MRRVNLQCPQTTWAKRWLCALTLPVAMLLLTACGNDPYDLPLWVTTDVQTADIDGDGRLDVITIAEFSPSMSDASQSEGHLVVRRQTAPGIFAAQNYIVGVYPWKLEVADIDGDGAPDLVVTDAGRSATGDYHRFVWLLKQDPEDRGTFLPAQLVMETTSTPGDIAIGDVNGDDVPDLVFTSDVEGIEGATLLVQNAAQRGSFLSPTPLALPGDATAVSIGDLNGDGRNDIVLRVSLPTVGYISATALGVLYQQVDGTLSPWQELPSAQSGVNSRLLTVTDVDGDGVNDVVEFFTPQSTDYRAFIATLIQDRADNTFSMVSSSLTGIEGTEGGVVADLDGDGLPDFATVGVYPSQDPVRSKLNILMQDGTGAFGLTQSLNMPTYASNVAAGDLNADGLNDLVVFGGDNELFTIHQSAAAPGTFVGP